MKIGKFFIFLSGGLVVLFLLVSILGFIKFNLIGNDVYFIGDAVVEEDLLGRWVERIPGGKGWQGIELSTGGKARSINMNTLVYHTWELQEGNILLSSTSIGNGQRINEISTFNISLRADKNRLELLQERDAPHKAVFRVYKKQKPPK